MFTLTTAMIPVICDKPDRRGLRTASTSFPCMTIFSGFGE
jgi:hypothetical protein